MELKSTYGLIKDWSYRGEIFYTVPSLWNHGSIPILKIRIANWKPKYDRSDTAIFYYDVRTKEDANKILGLYKLYNFKKIEKEAEKMWNKDNFDDKGCFNSGETDNWWTNKFIPYIRLKYPKI